MSDSNMHIWATESADTSNLRLSIDIPQAAQFANQINELLGRGIVI